VYHLSVTGILKNAIDRLGQGLLSRYRDVGLPWSCKVAGVLTQGASKFGGQEYTLQFMVAHLIIMNNLVVSPDGLNALGVAGSLQDKPDRTPGVIGQYDPDSLERSQMLGKRVAEIAKIIKAGATALQHELPKEYAQNVLQRQEFALAAMAGKPT
jgi:multimeric flavodoxin WrbA